MLKKIFLIAIIATISTANLLSQKVGFISSQMIRDKLSDAKIADQRLQTMIDEWNREIASMEEIEANMQFEIKKNRLIWSDAERATKEKEYIDLQMKRQKYAKEKYETGGEYDKITNEVMKPVEEKIFAAVQQVASKDKYDMIWDQSTQPLAYVNFKYDITLKVLKALGVNVDDLEKEQSDKIKKDPRNDEEQRKEAQQPRKRSRTASKKSNETDAPTPTATDTLQMQSPAVNPEREIKR